MGTKVNVDLIAREITYNAPSSRWWDQLANSIMFGLFFATALTLIITPCMIALSERRKERQAKDV
jgi:multidrug efflux pump